MAEYRGPLDYIDVATRIVEFREKFPDGSLQQVDIKFIDFAGKSWVVYTAAAYRTPDDTRPGVGTAWEPVPGPTKFTRDSEVQNAETAAWGRAMVAALAVDTKHVASQEEVRNREAPAIKREWLMEADDLNDVDALRLLWAEAKAAGVSATDLDWIKSRAERLSDSVSKPERAAGSVVAGKGKGAGE